MRERTRFINLDESWLNQSDFRRRKWVPKGTINSQPTSLIWPRIAIIAAIDNFGEIYLSLL